MWDDATSFKPERFENGEVEGNKLMPFGIGRRTCPGLGLAQRTVSLTLGSLIQSFEWERFTTEEVDIMKVVGSLCLKPSHWRPCAKHAQSCISFFLSQQMMFERFP